MCILNSLRERRRLQAWRPHWETPQAAGTQILGSRDTECSL